MTYPLLLALDLASHVGWALMRRHQPPSFGTVHLTGSIEAKHDGYTDWLEAAIAREKPDGIAWEAPLLMPSDTIPLITLLYGLQGITKSAQRRHRLPYQVVPIYAVKIAITGTGRADKTMMIAGAMSTFKWEVEDHNQADAGGVGLVAYDNLWHR